MPDCADSCYLHNFRDVTKFISLMMVNSGVPLQHSIPLEIEVHVKNSFLLLLKTVESL